MLDVNKNDGLSCSTAVNDMTEPCRSTLLNVIIKLFVLGIDENDCQVFVKSTIRAIDYIRKIVGFVHF